MGIKNKPSDVYQIEGPAGRATLKKGGTLSKPHKRKIGFIEEFTSYIFSGQP